MGERKRRVTAQVTDARTRDCRQRVEQCVSLVQLVRSQEVSQFKSVDRVAVTMHIEVHAPVQALFDIDPGHRNPVLELVPRLLCVNVLLGGLDDLDMATGLGIAVARDDEAGERAGPGLLDRPGHDGAGLARAQHDRSTGRRGWQMGRDPQGRIGGGDGRVEQGQAVRIFTGGPVPDGADAIVIQEDTTARDDAITMNEAAKAGRWVRRKGMDFAQGDVLLSARPVLTGRHIGLAAAMNVPWLTVRRKPRVAILATGDELVMPGEAVGASQIISSNSLSVAAYVHELGGNPINLGIARDSEDSLRKMLTGAQGADLLITIGGASVGDHDLVRRVLDGEGFDLNFFRVAMRPGKPLIFGQLGRVPVLGLPGNPVSAGVTAVIFLRPAMNIMLGTAQDEGPAETALLGCDVAANDQRQDYLRATLSIDGNGQRIATPFDAQDSAMMARFAAADCLVIRPPHATPVKAGDMVEIIPL